MPRSPIIAGFHPDPSICRVGEDYFLVNSSFEYFPGVPVFTSRDLTLWRQLGNVLDRSSQLSVREGIGGASGGIYAPTIRHHDGRFWMTTTNIHDIARGHLIVHAEDPAGPWSDPVYTAGLLGIDPDLAWDDDGRCLLTWSDVVRGGISQAVVDPVTGEVLSEAVSLWHGTGGAHAEGPHLLRRGDWWYLLVAEGGTGAGHMVTVARSKRPDGPFEANPANPILTHRSTSDAVQATGHADMLELADGSWAMVHLGTRPRGSFPRWHTNGRETFLAGISWIDDWPVVNEDQFEAGRVSNAFVEEFTAARLDPRWISPGVEPATFAVPDAAGLRLSTNGAADGNGPLLAVRAADQTWAARAHGQGDYALEVRIDARHRAAVRRVAGRIEARIEIGPFSQIIVGGDAATDAALEVRTVTPAVERGMPSGPDVILLGTTLGEDFQELTRLDGRYLSTEVAGGFTGRVVGVSAIGGNAVITRFAYASTEDSAI